MFSTFSTVFRGLLGAEESPTKVIEVRSDNYISRPVLYRKDSMILYAPKIPPDSKNTKDRFFEIILHKPFTESLHTMYRSEYLLMLYLSKNESPSNNT